ncbi:MAG: hypothetical protein E7187_02085 [Erysipelotrichaceae bacterium]|nr:hypothetical protein [Erysipelotrichaceae bacterium]
MEKKILVLSEKCGLIVAAVFCFLNWKVSLGVLLGLIFYRIYFMLLSGSIGDAIKGNAVLPIGGMLRVLCLAVPLLAGVKLPQYFNIWGVLAGLLMFVPAAVFVALSRK